MPKSKGVRVSLLIEDELLERFAREVLMALGFSRHEIFVTPYPVGKGSAKQWVTQEFPKHVQQYRRKANHQNIVLLIGTEADELTVEVRRRQLFAELESGSFPSRSDDERIVLWIPRWHVETWILKLSGRDVDEEHDYKKDLSRPRFSEVAAAFVTQLRSSQRGEELQTLPSLLAAYWESNRIRSTH